MVLTEDKFDGVLVIDFSEEDNQDSIDNSRKVLVLDRNFLSLWIEMLTKVPIGRSHTHLAQNDQAHKGETDGHSDEQLSLVGVPSSNLPLMLRVWINSYLAFEVLSLGCCIFKISYEPLVGDIILLTFPTFMEQSDPDHYAEAINDTIRSSHHRIELSSLVKSINDIGYSEEETNDGDRNEPARVMDKPSKVESKLLAIVVFDEIEWLHICKEAFEQHT